MNDTTVLFSNESGGTVAFDLDALDVGAGETIDLMAGGAYASGTTPIEVTVSLTMSCPNDVNGDAVVDLADLATLLANFGVSNGATHEMGDLNADGGVDLSDLAALLSAFGTQC
jgi:hypothetical protein